MGGAETLYTGLNNLDKFAWIGSFSGAFVMWPRADGTGGARRAGSGSTADRPRRGSGAAGAPRRPGDAAAAAARRSMTRLRDELSRRWTRKPTRESSTLFIACGTADGLVGVNRQFKTWLKTKGVQFTEEEAPDMGHVWPLWRKNLADFVQKTFQPKAR